MGSGSEAELLQPLLFRDLASYCFNYMLHILDINVLQGPLVTSVKLGTCTSINSNVINEINSVPNSAQAHVG